MTNIKAAKVQAKEIFNVAYDKIQNITVKGGFLGMQDQPLDWNARMIVVANLLWDTATRQKDTAEFLTEEVSTTELTSDAEEAITDIETFLILSTQNLIGEVIEDWTENFETLTISQEILQLVEDTTETLTERILLLGELGVLFAKAVRQDLNTLNADTEEMDDYIKYSRQIADEMATLWNTELENTTEVEEVASTPSAINDLEELFNAVNA
jgi:hypothetical protein